MAYLMARAQSISSYFNLEAVMPHWENCVSACMNHIWGLAGQNEGNCIAMMATVFGGSSVNMSVTVRIVSHKKYLIDDVKLSRFTNCSFFMNSY